MEPVCDSPATDETVLADLMVRAVNTYNNRRYLKIAPALQEESLRELDSFGILSVQALAAIVDCTEYRVLEAVGADARRARGKLNPRHLPWLAYGLSMHEIKPDTLRSMLKQGTSISTIADLTGISPATLYRWRKQ